MKPASHTLCWSLFSVASLLALICFPALAQKGTDAAGQDNSAKYAGAEGCQGCHEDQYKSFSQSAHVQTLKNEKPSEQGCEGCRGPGVAHTEAGDPDKIRFADARPDTTQAVCTTCHKVNLGSTSRLDSPVSLAIPLTTTGRRSFWSRQDSQLCQRCHRGPPPGPFHL
jgi:hypothetical protein